ncbi:flagellar brake protein [Metabacillus sp. HB246100]|uniref:flagellar brake protein n=1 Tax=Bacillus weihaiensis TaxID=1547283 RepID=UPI00235766CD|nr:flagellar brake domain-containing protein [Bacillus weihaiensis]
MIKIGDVINLETNGEVVEKLKCKLVERSGNKLFIDYPVNSETGRTAFLMLGTELIASFINKENVYRFQTEVTGRVKENIPMISLTYPGDDHLFRIQRREYVRIDTTVDIAIHPIHNEFEAFTAVTTDISAGGAALLVPKNNSIHANQVVTVWFALPFQNNSIKYVKIEAKLVRFIETENNHFIKVPIQFIDIDEEKRQLLIKYCFEQQIIMRRKGLTE